MKQENDIFDLRASPESNPQDLNCIYNQIKTHLPGGWYNYSSNTILVRMILNHQFSTSSPRQLRFIKFARLINNMTWYFPNIYFSSSEMEVWKNHHYNFLPIFYGKWWDSLSTIESLFIKWDGNPPIIPIRFRIKLSNFDIQLLMLHFR